MLFEMTRWPSTSRIRDAFSWIFADLKRRMISTNKRNSAVIRQTENSFQPIKMAYNSFESVNSVDLSSNVPIIIMHGLLGSKNNWNNLSKHIHNRTKRKVITVDARNHGDSPHTPEMSYPHLANDVRHLMIDLNIPKASVIGHSMGGRAMMLFALKYSELVESLTVVDISPVRDSPHLKETSKYLEALQNLKLEANQPLSSARREADRQLQQHVKDRNLRQFFLANLIEKEHGTFGWKMNLDVLKRHFNDIASFPSVDGSFNGPTYFIAGGMSDFVLPQDHDNIKKFFPKAIFDYIENAGHWLHAEKPMEFLQIVCKNLSCP